MLEQMIEELKELMWQSEKDMELSDTAEEANYYGGESNAYEKSITIAEKYKAKEPRWIPVEERLPEEEDILGKKMSDMVCVACESEKGKHIISASHTNDGEWTIEKMLGFKVIAWMQLPEYEEGGAE